MHSKVYLSAECPDLSILTCSLPHHQHTLDDAIYWPLVFCSMHVAHSVIIAFSKDFFQFYFQPRTPFPFHQLKKKKFNQKGPFLGYWNLGSTLVHISGFVFLLGAMKWYDDVRDLHSCLQKKGNLNARTLAVLCSGEF